MHTDPPSLPVLLPLGTPSREGHSSSPPRSLPSAAQPPTWSRPTATVDIGASGIPTPSVRREAPARSDGPIAERVAWVVVLLNVAALTFGLVILGVWLVVSRV